MSLRSPSFRFTCRWNAGRGFRVCLPGQVSIHARASKAGGRLTQKKAQRTAARVDTCGNAKKATVDAAPDCSLSAAKAG